MANATLSYCLEPAFPEAHISGVQLSKPGFTEVHFGLVLKNCNAQI